MSHYEEEILRIIKKNVQHGLNMSVKGIYGTHPDEKYVDLFQHIQDLLEILDGKSKEK